MENYEQSIINEIASAFSLPDEAAKTACLLLQARAQTLDFTFDEYMKRYHPEGIAMRDDNLPEQWRGYVQFLGKDASTVLRAGRGADFFTFVHECAHVFRRQLTGELREQAEKAFGIENGSWNIEKEELFADGLEQWIKTRHGRGKEESKVYGKGESFVDTIYRGMGQIVEMDRRMEEVYERLFEDRKYIFNQSEYENTVKKVIDGNSVKASEIFLGMTPQIYEDLSLQRLPVTITVEQLSSTIHAGKSIESGNPHALTEDILRQIPEQLKNPLCIIQDTENETDIITVLSVAGKDNNEMIIPLRFSQKGNLNRAEIDINLVKSAIASANGLEYWLKQAADDKRLLYFDNKKTEPVYHFLQGSSVEALDFVTENNAKYKETIRRKFPERFALDGQERILYKAGEQLMLDFSGAAQQAVEPKPVIKQALPLLPPHPNTHEYFTDNFAAIAGDYKNDTIEAARFLLRGMAKEDRETTIALMRERGCTDRESYHRYLNEILSSGQRAKTIQENIVEQNVSINSTKEKRVEEDQRITSRTLDIISSLENTDIDKFEGFLDSALNALRDAKAANLTTIKRQYEYEGSVGIGGTELYRNDIPKGSSPKI